MAAQRHRPANSHDSAVSLTIFKLFSRPYDKSPNLTVFLGNVILKSEMKCYLC